jgi:hypothetical protein
VRLPLKDVKVRQVNEAKSVANPIYADNYWQMNQNEFAMQVEGVADFYACDGREVEYAPADGAGNNEVELYLNGSIYGAILHQRKILPLHGSSFRYGGMGVMICGDAGAGKSSLTASFYLNGAEFLTDDVTPVVFRDGIPYVRALSDRIKLWGDALRQLEKEGSTLDRIFPGTDKYFYPMNSPGGDTAKLEHIFIIEIDNIGSVTVEEISGPGKFAVIRGEIYRAEYLQGMPENEAVFFRNIVDISRNVKVFRVRRPSTIRIARLHEVVEGVLNQK